MATTPKTTEVRCRIEKDLKDRATAILQSCGLSISDAMRLFLRQVVATQGLSFEVKVPSEKTTRALGQAREIRRQFDSMEETLQDLDGEAGEEAKAGRNAKKRDVHG